MRNWLQQFGLIAFGACLGAMLCLTLSAVAQLEGAPTSSLPVEELRTLTEVFGRIKSDYVEPVDDKKLITGAINGMVSDLDPHSAYLEGEDFQELENETSGEFGGLGMEVGMEDGFVKVVSPIDDSPAARADATNERRRGRFPARQPWGVRASAAPGSSKSRIAQ